MKLVVLSVFIGILASIPYVYYAIRLPHIKPDHSKCVTIIGWATGAVSSIWTIIRATYYALMEPDKLGVFQGEYVAILIGCIAMIWVATEGICDVYKPIYAFIKSD